MCTVDGWPRNGSKTYWPYWKWPEQPSLYDIFLDEDNLIVILNFRFSYLWNSGPRSPRLRAAINWSQTLWTLMRHDGTRVISAFQKNDPQLHTKVLVFPYNRTTTRPDIVTIFSSDRPVVYKDVPFCRLPPRVKRFGAICAQSFVTSPVRVLDWVAWHRAHGFDHAMLYINQIDGAAKMEPLVAKAVENGSLIIIDWGWPWAYRFHDQPASQASCLWRSKGRFRWLGINDLDEIFLPGMNETVADVLNRYEPMGDRIGSIACCNRWLGRSDRVLGLRKCAFECIDPPGRQKNIVRVENVDYFCNHQIMLGLPEQQANGFELVNGHAARFVSEALLRPCGLVQRFKPQVEKWLAALS
jgi:hypothetical protein